MKYKAYGNGSYPARKFVTLKFADGAVRLDDLTWHIRSDREIGGVTITIGDREYAFDHGNAATLGHLILAANTLADD